MTLTELSNRLAAVKAADLTACNRSQLMSIERLLASNGAPGAPAYDHVRTDGEIQDRVRGLIADGFCDDKSHEHIDGPADVYSEPTTTVDPVAAAVVQEMGNVTEPEVSSPTGWIEQLKDLLQRRPENIDVELTIRTK